ncbi:hypothetical protein LWI28_004026 [Acer negundo]|uniref:DNA-directed primase/polymerase protein n=1 Tax=Acer negundo TaxID=4023 RepID=A0AAD5IFE4_ACENE|nr:hypothetical protein LWI28_004026 [Acer negundo]
MDDVDRLFECFKCGISPPPSAVRERKRRKTKLKKEGSKHGVSTSFTTPSPGSAGHGQKSATDIQSSMETLGLSTVKVSNSIPGKQISPVIFYGTPHGVPPKRPLSLLRLLHEIRLDLSEHHKSNLRYKSMDSKFRHHYEVIQEGLPCHLYFDLEFNKKDNAEKNGDEMVDLLISVTLDALRDNYCIEGNEDWIIELDSSTGEKFSRHLVIRIPKTAFKDNSHAGAFVAECEEDMFLASLICNMDDDCEKLLVCKMELDCVKTLQFDTELHNNFGKHRVASQGFASNACSDVSTTCFMGKSPFPALDKFVECVASIGNVPGKIRSWYWFSEYGLIVYNMSRNRYCERIGRQHKSNNVMYVVDLRRAFYYQKCHDPDCKDYRSPLRPIPIDTIPDLMFSYDSGQQMTHHGGLTHIDIEYQLVDNDGERDLLYDDEQNTASCSKDPWWVEAVKVANDIENKQKTFELSNMMNLNDEEDEEDDEWWMAVEKTASQAELTHFN